MGQESEEFGNGGGRVIIRKRVVRSSFEGVGRRVEEGLDQERGGVEGNRLQCETDRVSEEAVCSFTTRRKERREEVVVDECVVERSEYYTR